MIKVISCPHPIKGIFSLAIQSKFLIFCFFLTGFHSEAQTTEVDSLFFRDRLMSVSDNNIFISKDYYNWGGSIIKGPKGRYHLFYSRWKKEYSFLGWLTHSEIAHAVSDHPAGPWEYVETVLKGRGQSHWDAITAHNPKIKYFEGKYYLYYIATNLGDELVTDDKLIETAHTGYNHPLWTKIRMNQRTGVVSAEKLSGSWNRRDLPLIEPALPITTLTVNPAITRGKDYRYYLIVKGDKPNETSFIRNQAIAISDNPDGPFVMQPRPVIDYLDTEDMSLWFDKQRSYYYGVFHAHSFIGMVSSPDGINWKKATEYNLTPKRIIKVNGDTIFPDRLERPFVYVENDEPQVLCLSVRDKNESYTLFIPVKQKTRPLPNNRQLAWQQAELGAIFHYDLHVFDGKKYHQAENRINPTSDYQLFNPRQLDTDQWIKSIKDAGFTFALLTATHETGFALFQSEANPYSMKALDFQDGKGDLVRDFVQSCRKYGIKPGIYLGIRWNSFFGVHNFEVDGTGVFRENRQKYYNKMVEDMLRELCTNYGELFEVWFDGGADHPTNGAPDVLPIVQQYQPNCLFYHNLQLAEVRWGGSESGTVGYPNYATFPNFYSHSGDTQAEHLQLLKQGDPDGQYWMPAMADAPLRGYNGRHEWFWEPGDEEHIFPLPHLMNMYDKSVGRNATLIMGLTPDPDGLLPEADVIRLREWGNEIKRQYGNPVVLTSGQGNVIEASWPKLKIVDRLIIQEDIRKGERVRGYDVEVLCNDVWTIVASGESIGHKRIQHFEPLEGRAIRLTIHKSVGEPFIKRLAAYEKLEQK